MDPETHRQLLDRRQDDALAAARRAQVRREARQARDRARLATRVPHTRARLAAWVGRVQRALDPEHGRLVDRRR